MNFPQFAFNNVKRNGRAYFAYFLSSAFTVMIFFTYAVFIYHPQLDRSLMGPMTRAGMQAAAYVVFVFHFSSFCIPSACFSNRETRNSAF